MVCLALGEGVFNLAAFNVLREPGWHTALMALCVIVGVPICAFAAGKWARQWPNPKLSTALWRMIIVLLVTFGGLYSVNVIRVSYLASQGDMIAKYPWLSWAFFPLNLLIFLAAALSTYLSTDPEPNFAETRRKMDGAASKVNELDSKIQRYIHQFDCEKAGLQQLALQVIARYRMINRRHRKTQAPSYFDDPSDANHLPQIPIYSVTKFVGASGYAAVPSINRASLEGHDQLPGAPEMGDIAEISRGKTSERNVTTVYRDGPRNSGYSAKGAS
jgi:hypothetical protein